MLATCFIDVNRSLVLIKVTIKGNMCRKGEKRGRVITGLSMASRLCLAKISTNLSLKKGSEEREVSYFFSTGTRGYHGEKNKSL